SRRRVPSGQLGADDRSFGRCGARGLGGTPAFRPTAGLKTDTGPAASPPRASWHTGASDPQPNPRLRFGAASRIHSHMPQAQVATPRSPETFAPDSFAAMFEDSLKKAEMRSGEVITAEVVRVEHSFVVVNAGLKS